MILIRMKGSWSPSEFESGESNMTPVGPEPHGYYNNVIYEPSSMNPERGPRGRKSPPNYAFHLPRICFS